MLVAISSLVAFGANAAGVPQEINYQGKVEVDGVPVSGGNQLFKFAIVDSTGTTTFWSNDGTSVGGAEPTSSVPLNVSSGLFSIRLGDTSYGGMTQTITPSVFDQPDRWLRVWFDDGGGGGFQQLGPDQKLASVPFALVAQSLSDNSIDGYKLQRESIWPEHEGRSNTVVSYFAEYSGTTGKVIVGTIPAGKTYVITDISYTSTDPTDNAFPANAQIEYSTPTTTILYKGARVTVALTGLAEPKSEHFKAGLPVPGGAVLTVGEFMGWANTQSCTISGFEFTN